jgi:hypothetical protein
MQINQQLNNSRNVIELLAPRADNTRAGLRGLREFLHLAPRKHRAANERLRFSGRSRWASGWEDASFAAMAAAGLAAVALALRVLA